MMRLVESALYFQEQRDARGRMLQEQDDAYKKSLEIDRAKVCARLYASLVVSSVQTSLAAVHREGYVLCCGNGASWPKLKKSCE